MNVKTVRNRNETNDSIGNFSVNGFPLCNSLEPPYGYNNDMGYTAVEPDLYDLELFFSHDFGCVVCMFKYDETTGEDVSTRYLEIHYGNSHAQLDSKGNKVAVTKGCTCLGYAEPNIADWVSQSQKCFKIFMEKYVMPACPATMLKLLNDNADLLSDMGKWELDTLHQLSPIMNKPDEPMTYQIINNF